jgi:hypothetical protein
MQRGASRGSGPIVFRESYGRKEDLRFTGLDLAEAADGKVKHLPTKEKSAPFIYIPEAHTCEVHIADSQLLVHVAERARLHNTCTTMLCTFGSGERGNFARTELSRITSTTISPVYLAPMTIDCCAVSHLRCRTEGMVVMWPVHPATRHDCLSQILPTRQPVPMVVLYRAELGLLQLEHPLRHRTGNKPIRSRYEVRRLELR